MCLNLHPSEDIRSAIRSLRHVYNFPRSAYSPGSIWTSFQPTRLFHFILSRLIHSQTHSSHVFTSLLDNSHYKQSLLRKSTSHLLSSGHTIATFCEFFTTLLSCTLTFKQYALFFCESMGMRSRTLELSRSTVNSPIELSDTGQLI